MTRDVERSWRARRLTQPVLSLILVTMLVSSCAVTTGGSYCSLYEPVFTDDETPEHVQRQIDRNNVAHCVLCDPKCPL